MVSVLTSSVVDRMDRITIDGVMVSVLASSVVDRMDRITIGGVMVSVLASSVVDRGGVMLSVHRHRVVVDR